MYDLHKKVSVPLTDPSFATDAFHVVAQSLKGHYQEQKNGVERACAEEYEQLSYHVEKSQVQEGCSVRNVLRARRLANLIISSEGEIQMATLKNVIDQMEQHLYSTGPNRQHDSSRQEHILLCLKQLADEEDLEKVLLSFSKPEGNRHAEVVIRESLGLAESTVVTDAHVRRAVLSAWLTYLRQSVGSCFGTAPAIIVQREQVRLFFSDLRELLTKGRLVRVIGGKEYSVPLSHSWGGGDLKKPMIFSRQLQEDTLPIWWSPGLLKALKSAGVFSEDETVEKRREKLKEMVESLLEEWEASGEYLLVTCEELIRKLLLRHFDLTEADVKEYEKRSPAISGMVPVPISGKKGVRAFIKAFQQAKQAFISLADHALLKTWEFTIASFAETKSKFTRWNLYSSLGFSADDPGGIGEILYKKSERLLEICNADVKRLQDEYEVVFQQVKVLEIRVRRGAESREDAKWQKAEYQSKLNEFHSLEELRNKTHRKAQRLAAMYQTMVDRYYELFPLFFQEVYDADMHIAVGQYDDSPAGFCLLFKHGRHMAATWSRIQTPQEFVEALAGFFVSTEQDLLAEEAFKGLKREVSEAITSVVHHVRTEEFLETAFYRMAKVHGSAAIKDPLKNLDKIEKKPWSYTSGGSVETLLSGYFSREYQPTSKERWVEDEAELLTYICDTLKELPYKDIEEKVKHPHKSYLMHSPTHVFLLKPGEKPFCDAWKSEAYTYTYIRDYFIRPREQFLYENKLTHDMMSEVVERIVEEIPLEQRHNIRSVFRLFPQEMRPMELRDYISKHLNIKGKSKYTPVTMDLVDRTLYSLLPLFSASELEKRVMRIMEELDEEISERVSSVLKQMPIVGGRRVLGACDLANICMGLIALVTGATSLPFNVHAEVWKVMRELKWASPVPIIFADSNWVTGYFGFLVNPGTGKFDFWLVDIVGSQGFPLSSWKQWMNGSRHDRKWGIFIKPEEYTSVASFKQVL